MFDIKFFQNCSSLKKRIVNKEFTGDDIDFLVDEFDKLRNNEPHVFNVETSNNCNMRCIMCPRTTSMTREIKNITDEEFESIINQISPHAENDLKVFLNFIEDEYRINNLSRSENAFYFLVSAQCLTLHGFGEPLIDKNIVKRVNLCFERKIPTYFSCVPANININKIVELMENGLSVLKFSIDSLDDVEAKAVRGERNNFTSAYKKLEQILHIKKEKKLQTRIVCTMLDLSTDEQSINKQKRFMELWQGKDVFAYVKSLDNRWYNDLDKNLKNKSHYSTQYCEFPWTSLSIMSNGNVVPCTQDYDAEMTFGNINNESLFSIWNNEQYEVFRRAHISGKFPKGHKCNERCDIKKAYYYLNDH